MGNQSVLHARESRSQTVHTIKFQSWIHGTLPSELKIEETDVTGFTRVESWEHHFYGIFNHGDYNATSWQNAQYMANYWRQFFNVETEGDSFPSYPDQGTGSASAWDNRQSDLGTQHVLAAFDLYLGCPVLNLEHIALNIKCERIKALLFGSALLEFLASEK